MSNYGVTETGEFPVMKINSTIGCTSPGGVILAGNELFSVGPNKIFRWTAETDEVNECNAYSISDPIAPYLDDSFFKNASLFYHAYRNDVWFYDTTGDGSAWIYNIDAKTWTKFNNIIGLRIFAIGPTVYMLGTKNFFRFEPSYAYDQDQNKANFDITGIFQSGLLDFGTNDKKRLSGIELVGDLHSLPLNVSVECDTGETVELELIGNESHQVNMRRLNSGRFNSATVTLTHSERGKIILHGLKLNARTKTSQKG